jgi:hypothetical protein
MEIFGAYRIEAEIGAGGMGRVFRAVHVDLARTVALKVLLTGAGAGSEAERRFEREARVAMTLRHASLVSVFDAGVVDGQRYIAMELIDGTPLHHLIARDGALAPARAARLAREVAEGLAYLHAHGIVHRDVKPSNVMVERSGRARLLDFGLALPFDATRMTEAGVVVGTPRYCAPEVLHGEDHTPASDVFGLGRMLDEMLPAERDGALADLVRKLTQPDPARRQLSSAKVVQLLAELESTPAARTAMLAVAPRPRTRVAAVAAAALLGAVLLTVLVATRRIRPQPPAPPPAASPSPPGRPDPLRVQIFVQKLLELRRAVPELAELRRRWNAELSLEIATGRPSIRTLTREVFQSMKRIDAELQEVLAEADQGRLEDLDPAHAEVLVNLRGLEGYVFLWSSRWRDPEDPGIAGRRRWRAPLTVEALIAGDHLVAADLTAIRPTLEIARRVARLGGERIRSTPGAYIAGIMHVAGAASMVAADASRNESTAWMSEVALAAARAFDAFNDALVPAAAAPATDAGVWLDRLVVRTWLWGFRGLPQRAGAVLRGPDRLPFTRDGLLADYRELEALVPADYRKSVASLRDALAR